MTYEPSEAVAFRQRLLTSPGERAEVDYKSSVPFEGDDNYTLKLIRHIIGMANADGGWLVIGFNGIPPKLEIRPKSLKRSGIGCPPNTIFEPTTTEKGLFGLVSRP